MDQNTTVSSVAFNQTIGTVVATNRPKAKSRSKSAVSPSVTQFPHHYNFLLIDSWEHWVRIYFHWPEKAHTQKCQGQSVQWSRLRNNQWLHWQKRQFVVHCQGGWRCSARQDCQQQYWVRACQKRYRLLYSTRQREEVITEWLCHPKFSWRALSGWRTRFSWPRNPACHE